MKKRNRIAVWLCLVLTVLMVVSVMPVSAISVAVGGVAPSEGNADTPASAGDISVDTGNPAIDDAVPVGNPGEGYVPAGTPINSTEEFNNMDPAGSYYLAADITVSKTFAGFSGVFDGNGHTVTTSVSLFNAPQSATIKNLTVAGSITTSNNGNTGAVASGSSFDCNFFNILNKANISAPDGTTETEHRAAGIAGRTAGYTIFERCTNEGALTGNGLVGGIAALASADESSEAVFINCVNKGTLFSGVSAAAGIAAAVECPIGVTLFYNCRNVGNVTGKGATGGMIGYTTQNTANTVSVRLVGCTNAGVITANDNHAGGMVATANTPVTVEQCTNEATGKVVAGKTSTSDQRQGGAMVGHSQNVAVLIADCENYADIEGTGQTGGIGGWLWSANVTIRDCKNTGNVTSRLNYAAGIVCRLDLNNYLEVTNNTITDCVNEGNVTSYKGNTGGILGYVETPVTLTRCINKGNVGPRDDAPQGNAITAGGIVGGDSCPITITDCRNEGNVTGKCGYTITDGVVKSEWGGYAAGIIGTAGNGERTGVTSVVGCVNTGKMTAGTPMMTNPVSNYAYAGGIIGYQYGGGFATYLEVRYCVNTGDVEGGTNAGYVAAYTNSTFARVTDNVFAGTLRSMAYPSGYNTTGSSVLNALFWDNNATLFEYCYARNWVVDTFAGTMLNNLASTGAGTPVSMDEFLEYRFSEGDDPFDVFELCVLDVNPRDAAPIEIATPEAFMTMDPLGNYKLTADITLTETYGTNENRFAGTLDGDGHTLFVSRQAFHAFASGAVIRNLTLAPAAEDTVVTHDETTGVLALYGGATFINVHNTVNVKVTTNNAGGIIGSTSGQMAWFENCTNSATIEDTAGNAGGICGYSNAGLATYVNCVNTGAIKATAQNAGGIIGRVESTGKYTKIIGCINKGTVNGANRAGGMVGECHGAVTTYTDCANIGAVTGPVAGGIQGYNGTDYVIANYCYNGGEINATNFAGGIIGDTAKGALITGCVNTAKITVTNGNAGGIYNHHGDNGCKNLSATNCINTGAISGNGGSIGGIAGENHQIADNYRTSLTSCINLGTVSGASVNMGSLVGYCWGSDKVGLNVNNCIAAGTVTTTNDRCGAIIGYLNSNQVTIKNNVIVATLSAKTATHLYYGTNSANITAKANIANNAVKPGIAMYDAQKGHGATTIALGTNSTGTLAMNDFAIDTTVTKNLLLVAGILPNADGKFGAAFDTLFGAENNTENRVAVYNAEGTLVATVTSLSEVGKYLTEGATVKLLADYYAAQPGYIVSNGVSYTIDGNGFAIYAANVGKYMLGLMGSGSVTLNNFVMYTQSNAVYFGVSRRAKALNLNVNGAKIYAGGTNEKGYSRYTTGGTVMQCSDNLSTIEITSDTVFKNAVGVQLIINRGKVNIHGGTYTTRVGAIETWHKDVVVNVYNGTFTSNGKVDAALITAGNGIINVFDGRFENDGLCVARALGGKTADKKEGSLDNTIITETNATLNISGGVFVANLGSDGGWHAVIRCGGGSAYGKVNISGGTFVNQKAASEQVIFKNNTCASLSITGGKFLASAGQKYFMNTNGNADVTTESGYTPACSHGDVATSAYSGTYTFEGNSYKVWTLFGATNDAYAMETLEGAQVRMTAGSTGLRFISVLSADKVAAAKALAGEGGTVSYGTVIAPMDFVVHASAFTMEALDAAEELKGFASKYADIPASVGLTENEDGSVEIRAALVNIKEENYTRAFAAVAYVRVETAEGAVTYFYGEFDGVNNVRAIRQVAEAALADMSETKTDDYKYVVYDTDGETVLGYSKYGANARNVLKSFV